MIYEVSAKDLKHIRLNEKDPVAAAIQGVALVLATVVNSVPLYRDFGMEREFLDLPSPAAEQRMRAPIREAVEQWVPEATVRKVTFARDEEKLDPHVEVEINIE